MTSVPAELEAQLREYQQLHVLADWDRLTMHERAELVHQLRETPYEELRALYRNRDRREAAPAPERIAALPWPNENGARQHEYALRAREALTRGEVAFLVVAGGQGTRLGFDLPKGMYRIAPITGKSLFQIHAEKILSLQRRHRQPFPFLVMTSTATHEPTVRFFEQHHFFGLPETCVRFFCQGTMPALDLATGRLLLERPGRLCLSPNGHGGALTGLADSGLLDELAERGIKTVSYFQVDNPLVQLHDPYFLGKHVAERAEVSTKVVVKEFPTEKLGNLALIDGRCGIIEYSDLPPELAEQRDEHGRLRLWAGNTAIHLLDVEFLRRVTDSADSIPWHLARKKVPYWNGHELVQPQHENALKFERFIFDVLPQAERWSVAVTTRAAEFEPLKNATGRESPHSVRQTMCNLYGTWLEAAGFTTPRDADGTVSLPIEISPLLALDADELREKLKSQGLHLS
jgi:UDP-N-acetylglucosamine/UDP-N-acetylgalactosamine diphosphorylase